MFDSRSLRRKLGNFIPGENVRQSLQNVLTVEWDTHKTVLVDVPGATAGGRSPDMEMEGMGLNRREDREGYGRLEDDRDDDLMDSPNMGIEPSSSSSGTYFDRPIPRPSQSSRSGSYHSEKRLPQIPSSPTYQAQHQSYSGRTRRDEDISSSNPFVSVDDFDTAPHHAGDNGNGIGSGNGFLQPNRQNAPAHAHARPERTRTRTMEEGWDTFGTTGPSLHTGTRDMQDSRRSRERAHGLDGDERFNGPNSPSSSRGTRDSAQTSSTMDDNPFR